jgi:putative N-acetylmannosamine-6-phosphate epimerase
MRTHDEIPNSIQGELIVSCQALEDELLHKLVYHDKDGLFCYKGRSSKNMC